MSTLRNVIDQLKENLAEQSADNLELRNTIKEMSESFVSAIAKSSESVDNFILAQERRRLQEKENSREEGRRDGSGRSGRSESSSSDERGIFSRLFAATGLGTLAARLIAPILAPLKSIMSLLRVGGPVALVVGALYAVFKDIGENETFQNALVSIQETWNKRIIPAFNRIKEIVQNLFETEEFSNTLTSLKDEWIRIHDVIQDFVINTVSVVVESIAGVIEGIVMMMEGDFLGGFTRISNSILNGIAGLADNVITSVLRLFGADFGENGSFRTWLDKKLVTLGADVTALWNNFITDLSNRWNSTVTFFTETIPEKISNLRDGIVEKWTGFTTALSDRWNSTMTFLTETLPDALVLGWEAARDLIGATINYAVTRIQNGLMESFENLKNTVLSVPDQIRLAIIENLRFSLPTIEIPLPRRLSELLGLPESFTLLNGFSVGVGTPDQAEEIRGQINERSLASTEAIAGYRSNTAESLEELNAARENFRTVMNTPIVNVNNVDNSSTNSSNATIRYDNTMSPYDLDAYIRRGMAPLALQ